MIKKITIVSVLTSILFASTPHSVEVKTQELEPKEKKITTSEKSLFEIEKEIINNKDFFIKSDENELKQIEQDVLDSKYKKEEIKVNEIDSELNKPINITKDIIEPIKKDELNYKIKEINELLLKIDETLKRIEESNNKKCDKINKN